MTGQVKKGILVVSFGTSIPEVCAVSIAACEERIAASFPGYIVRRAFTSSIIRKILLERDGLEVFDTAAALAAMKAEGVEEVAVQPLHIIAGQEYHDKVLKPARQHARYFAGLAVGRPLLTTISDYRQAVAALSTHLKPLRRGQAHLLMAHGSSHPANASYSCLQLMLADSIPGVYLATVEGYPELPHVLPHLRRQGIKEVILSPYMLVAGEHARNDMAGCEEGSWKQILEKEGFQVKVELRGLGEFPAYQDIFVQRVRECLAGQGHITTNEPLVKGYSLRR